jgi:hypothetical protein
MMNRHVRQSDDARLSTLRSVGSGAVVLVTCLCAYLQVKLPFPFPFFFLLSLSLPIQDFVSLLVSKID